MKRSDANYAICTQLATVRTRAIGLANRALRNRDDAEDAVQSACIKALQNANRYDQARPFDKWFLRIVYNVCVDLLRRKSGACVSLDTYFAGCGHITTDIPDELANPANAHLGTIVDDRLLRAMDELRPDVRQAIILVSYGYNYIEIAKMMDCAIGTIRSRLHRGRILLKEKLGPDFNPPNAHQGR